MTFRAVMEDTRQTLARGLLRVAFPLGYADQGTFTRAFRRCTGVSQ